MSQGRVFRCGILKFLQKAEDDMNFLLITEVFFNIAPSSSHISLRCWIPVESSSTQHPSGRYRGMGVGRTNLRGRDQVHSPADG